MFSASFTKLAVEPTSNVKSNGSSGCEVEKSASLENAAHVAGDDDEEKQDSSVFMTAEVSEPMAPSSDMETKATDDDEFASNDF